MLRSKALRISWLTGKLKEGSLDRALIYKLTVDLQRKMTILHRVKMKTRRHQSRIFKITTSLTINKSVRVTAFAPPASQSKAWTRERDTPNSLTKRTETGKKTLICHTRTTWFRSSLLKSRVLTPTVLMMRTRTKISSLRSVSLELSTSSSRREWRSTPKRPRPTCL